MLVVRFTHPVDVPELATFGLPVQPAPITLPAEPVRDLYVAYMDHMKSEWHADRSQVGTEDEVTPASWLEQINERFLYVNNYFHDEFERVSRVRAALDRACGGETGLELGDDVHLWWFCSQVMFAKGFVLIGCPACGQDYSPEQCSVQGWSEADWLFGRRVTCPADHNLYVCAESEYEPRGPCWVQWVPSSIHTWGRPRSLTEPRD
jgi:hypothetical protein